MNVLISLHKGYGLGDGVQMSAVLQHVAKYRPEWSVDYRADKGREVVGRGIVKSVRAHGDRYSTHRYDAEVQILLYDKWTGWADRPNTNVSAALHDHFGIGWDAECGRYRVDVSKASIDAASALIHGAVQVSAKTKVPRNLDRPKNKYVAVHYQGDSASNQKDLTHAQTDEVCKEIIRLGRLPLILDWRGKCPLAYPKATIPQFWGGDAEMVSAVIWQCEAFVGIDSGPAKCASSTDVPSLVVWTGHHPARFHDPAPNTTHLVPENYHELKPVCGNRGVIDWFEANYNVQTYKSPVESIKNWFSRVLK